LNHGDRLLGIGLGVAIGVAIVVAFVFLGSEDTVDAPSLSGTPTQTAPAPPPEPSGTPLVRVAGGKPAGSPPKIEAKRGEQVKFKVRSDSPAVIEVSGVPGQSKSVGANKTVTFDFKARKAGLFAVIVAASHITVATVEIAK
jgi:hypothetical protein